MSASGSTGRMPLPPIGGTNMDQVDRMLARPKLYYNIDGMGELSGGLMCLAFSILGTMQLRAPKESVWHSMYFFIIYVGLMLVILKYGIQAIKKHITYPRTGFVEYRKRDKMWPGIFAALLAPLVVALIATAAQRHWDLTMFVALLGLLFTGVYAYHFARTVRWKWLVTAAIAFVSVLIVAFPQIWFWVDSTWIGAYWLMFMLDGALLFISGGISFCLYLRHTQAPGEESQ